MRFLHPRALVAAMYPNVGKQMFFMVLLQFDMKRKLFQKRGGHA
jgi:hypothetical protein